MTAQIIDGKAIAAKLRGHVARFSAILQEKENVQPGLATVLVGADPASQVYVRAKGKAANECGFHSVQHSLPTETSEADLLKLLDDLNADPKIHGILVQLPLPDHIDESKILTTILPTKDVDGFHPINVGLLNTGDRETALLPCTPAGSIILAKSVLGSLSGLNAVVVGRSNIVGKPAAALLLAESCTVTIAHSRTKDLASVVRNADIVVAAVGRPKMIKGDWIKEGACVIDVGINRIDAPERGEGKTRLVGDVDFDEAIKRAGSITPVPGGVGPMTIAMLMVNTFTAAHRAAGHKDIDFSALDLS